MIRLFFIISFSFTKVVCDNAVVRGKESDIAFANFVQHENSALQGHPLQKVSLSSMFDCLNVCDPNTRCLSVNFNTTVDDKGLFECVLLDFDKYRNEANLTAVQGIDHYALPSTCDEKPCKHNSKCIPVYVTKENYYCQCLPGTSGKNCHTEEFRSCAQRYAAGYNDSGVYAIKAPDNTTLEVYCSQDNSSRWTMVFKAVTGQALSQGPSLLWTSNSVLETPVALTGRGHYKNRLVEQWTAFKPNKVRLSLYKDTREVLQLVLNGAGSDKTNWFAAERVLSSPWTDLLSQPKNFFSIVGDRRSDFIRSFFMNSFYGGCELDLGWMALIEKDTICNWGKIVDQYTILYSPTSARVKYHDTAARGAADMMVIYLE